MENNKINCEMIKDLLPSYMDDLLSESVREEVEYHIKVCEDCRSFLNRLEHDEIKRETDIGIKEARFIKKARRLNYYMIGFIIGAIIPVLTIIIYILIIIFR